MSKKDKQKKAAAEAQPTETQETAKKKKVEKSDYSYVVQNKKARALTKHRKAITIVGIIILILILLAGLIYGYYSAIEINNFRIYIESSGSKIFSLSKNANMIPGSEMIEIIGPDKMTNTTLASGKNLVDSVAIEDRLIDIINAEGSITTVKDHFIAGTFYMMNISDEDKLYGERISFNKSTLGARNAMRIMLIRNDEIKVYAAPKTDDNGEFIYRDGEGRRIYSDVDGYYYLDGEEKIRVEENGSLQREEVVPLASGYAERKLKTDDEGEYYLEIDDGGEPWMTEFFHDDDFAVYTEGIPIASGERVRYTIVIWFEGWDSDCIDKIVNDETQLALSFVCE